MTSTKYRSAECIAKHSPSYLVLQHIHEKAVFFRSLRICVWIPYATKKNKKKILVTGTLDMWLECFHVLAFSSSGEVEFQRAVPDTLTTWVASAFAVSNTTGFGVGELKPEVGFKKGMERGIRYPLKCSLGLAFASFVCFDPE